MKIEQTQCSETSAIKHHTPGNNPKYYTQYIFKLIKPGYMFQLYSHHQAFTTIKCRAHARVLNVNAVWDASSEAKDLHVNLNVKTFIVSVSEKKMFIYRKEHLDLHIF
jgi:hypothetical protein